MGRASKTWIVAIANVLALAAPAHAKYDPSAFHPFEADIPTICEADIAGTDHADSLQGGNGQGVLGFGGDDTIRGDDVNESCMRGGAGDDRLTAGNAGDSLDGDAGDDRIDGGSGRDGIGGGYGADVLNGGPGPDFIDGGAGPDTIRGGAGNDRIRGGSERNSIDAGPGADEISSANGIEERVRCGSGRDEIWADRGDRLSGCERVHLVRNPWPAVTPGSGFGLTKFHLSFRSPFNTDDPCDCAGFFVQQTTRPPGAGCGRTDLTGWLYPSYARRSVSPITSLRRGGLCRGVYGGEVSFRVDNSDNCQTLRDARYASPKGDLGGCDLRIGIGSFSFRVR